MTPASNRGLRKGVRTLLQTIAGGGLTALVTVIAGGLDPAVQGLVMAVFTALTALIQNYLETAGTIPTILPSPGLVVGPIEVGPVAETVGTVEAATDYVGNLTGEVLDTAGEVVGRVTGQVDEDDA